MSGTVVKWIHLSPISAYPKHLPASQLTLFVPKTYFDEFLEDNAALLWTVLIKSFFLLLQVAIEGDSPTAFSGTPIVHIRQCWVLNPEASEDLLDDLLLRPLLVPFVSNCKPLVGLRNLQESVSPVVIFPRRSAKKRRMIKVYGLSKKKSEGTFPSVLFMSFFLKKKCFSLTGLPNDEIRWVLYLQEGLEEHTFILCWKTAVFSALTIKIIGARVPYWCY